MKKTAKNIFIEGFKQPSSIQPLPDVILSDLRGDGDNKLVLFDRGLSSLIVYKGVNRQFEKLIDIKNVSGMASIYEQNSRSPQPNIAISAENALYTYRGLKESFRLRIPNQEPDPAEQEIWSQYEKDPEKLTEKLMQLNKTKVLTQSGKYFIGANSLERKQQLIKKAFSEGIVERDSICSIAVIKGPEDTAVGNLVLFTELKCVHFLDNYGHSILKTMHIDVVAHQTFALGSFPDSYTVVCVGRCNSVCIIEKGEVRTFGFEKKAISSVLDWPYLYILTSNQTINCYNIEANNKKAYSMKLPGQPFQLELMKGRSYKSLLVAFKNQIRIYNQRNLVCRMPVADSLRLLKFGTFGRQQGCLILFYEQKGFEVKIVHRQFNPNQKLAKDPIENDIMDSKIPVPKKSTLFQTQCQAEANNCSQIYRGYVQDTKYLKWRVLKQMASQKSGKKLKVISSIMGLGPKFILRLELQNLTEQTIFNVRLGLNYDQHILEIPKYRNEVKMLIPNFSYPVDIELTNKSEPSTQTYLKVIVIEQNNENNVIAVMIPACDMQ